MAAPITRCGLALCALLVMALTSATARAREVAAWSVQDVLTRVQQMDPRLRVQAADLAIAEIARRRASWNRVQGGLRLHAGYQVSSTGWAATEATQSRTQDQAFGAAVAEARLPLYSGGRISAELDAAQARLRLAKHDEALLRLQLVSTALVAFAEALAAQEQTVVSEKAYSRARELVEITRKRREAGIDTEADVARAQLNLIRYEEELVTRRGDSLTALTTLRSVLLLDQHLPIELEGSLRDIAATAIQSSTHPELARAREALAAARADKRAAESGYLPTVELFGIAQYGNTLPGAPTTPHGDDRFGFASGSAAAGMMATWTAFDFFLTRDRIDTAEAGVALRRAEHDLTAVELERRRDEAVRREQAAASRLRVLNGAQRVAARASTLARGAYETGNATLVEVLDAEIEAIRLETNRVQAGLQLALAHIDRMYAEGSRP